MYLFCEAQIVTAIHSQICKCVAVFNPLTAREKGTVGDSGLREISKPKQPWSMLCNGSIWQLFMLCIWGWGNYCRLSMQQRPADQTRLSGQIMKMIQALSIDTSAMTRPFHKAMLFDAI